MSGKTCLIRRTNSGTQHGFFALILGRTTRSYGSFCTLDFSLHKLPGSSDRYETASNLNTEPDNVPSYPANPFTLDLNSLLIIMLSAAAICGVEFHLKPILPTFDGHPKRGILTLIGASRATHKPYRRGKGWERGATVTFSSRSEIEKGLRLHVTPCKFWLPDLDSNQGPAD
jgi:hypothetical protein